MSKRVKIITVIGYVLGVMYLTVIPIYLKEAAVAPFRLHAVLLAVLFGVQAGYGFALTKLQDKAREVLVGLNALAGLYASVLWFFFPELIQPGIILLNLFIILFLLHPETRMQFKIDWRKVRKSVLMVDDDPGQLKTVKQILLSNGYSVLTAASGEKGVQIARLQKPDLILLDVILPGLKGRDVCAQLKEDEVTKNIPVIFLTAKDSIDDIHAEMAVGGISHLTKPVNARTLLAEIKRVLG